MPSTNDQWEEIAEGFEQKSGIPRVVGALDGCLVQIERGKGFSHWPFVDGMCIVRFL